MKKVFFLLGLLFPFAITAQNILDLGIYNSPVGGNKLEIRIKPSQTVSNGVYSAGVFTVRFLSSYGVTLSAPAGLNNPLFVYALSYQGTDATYSYYSFSFANIFNVNWNSGNAYPIAILQINAGCGNGNGTFELINNNWTGNNNGDYYQELDGNTANNIFYQPTATAPLGVGSIDTTPPTIICTGNKTVNTDNSHCDYVHYGTAWDAIGADNCPGFTIKYILSGATIDTLYSTLNNTVFNKGLTTVKATITDIANLTANCTFTVTVNDTQAPNITAPAPKTTAANAAGCMATGVNLGTPVSSDNCPGAIVTNNAPATFALGTTTVTWTITDAAGNTKTSTQAVTVQSSLAASALNISSPQVCSGTPANLSFTIPTGVGPYTVVYSANGVNFTQPNYNNNQPIAVSPVATTQYKLVTVTDAIGCSISPNGLVGTLNVQSNPSLSSLLPSVSAVCFGDPVSFTAQGLLPNVSTTFNYTLNPGGPGSQTVTTSLAGSFTFSTATNPPGLYAMSIQSVTVNGCTTNFSSSNSGEYTVGAYPTISSITPSETIVCNGSPVYITASGLLPDVNTTFNYTINGVPGTQTVLTAGTGSVPLLSAGYPEGNYTVVITAVSVGGCSINTALSTSFAVDPFQVGCGFTVAGKLVTETAKGVSEAHVSVIGSGIAIPGFSFADISDTLGTYSFVNVIPAASNYTVKPLKDDNPINGLTTYDLVLISKHILGIEPLNSPYKMIAADANKSGSVTTFDIVEFRKQILGIYTKLPNNTSWRFVDKSFVFPNPLNPFQTGFPESYTATDVMSSHLAKDFVGIKIGDVNNTAVSNALKQDEDRSSGTAIFEVQDRIVQFNEIFEVRFKSLEDLEGFQFTIILNGLEAMGVQETDQVTAANFGIGFKDAVTVSIDGAQEFTLRFKAVKQGKLSEMLSISDAITRAEAYGKAGSLDVAFRFDGKMMPASGFELYQNQPNPFVNKTNIGFYLPEAAEAVLNIYNETGRLVYQQKGAFAKGEHSITLDRALMNTSGVLFYQLKTATDSATMKMIQVN